MMTWKGWYGLGRFAGKTSITASTLCRLLSAPLRERQIIPLLVEHFLRLYCTANKKPVKQLQPEMMEIFEAYSWPGNVRELENVVQRLVIMNDGPVIAAHHLPQQLLSSSAASQEAILIPEEGVDLTRKCNGSSSHTSALPCAERMAGKPPPRIYSD